MDADAPKQGLPGAADGDKVSHVVSEEAPQPAAGGITKSLSEITVGLVLQGARLIGDGALPSR